ncbi:MAG TPA: 16S rRNA (guanine(966)-N(2))-methyltransferase RsmD [Stellaceae bacterium]|nr:16S rRNA (guanine(966)-N(2))-methyltransferase RsmD [Stellaceae bacterium]
MRIVGGRLKGRALAPPPDETIRPTSDRAREALFNILEHGSYKPGGGSVVTGARVLDAFAGTGAIGLEALSRGAVQATFIEAHQVVLPILAGNIKKLGETDRAAIIHADARKPPRAAAPADVAFLDPPYGKGLAVPALVALVKAGWIGAATLIIVEVAAKEVLELPAGFETLEERRYGAARLMFARVADKMSM